MPLVTLIGEKLAKEESEFIYLGPNNECRNCKLKTVCFNLKIGRKYKITSIRDKRHNCSIHEGTVVVVEVSELPIITTIEKNISEGAKTKIENKECESIGCENYELCSVPLNKDKTFIVVKIVENIECPIGYELQKAEISEG
ncbi:MAG: hypothetical protein AYK22_08370 [Thermoplasmatales archaeon SG8-52-3]|nr:MAG: hypothetical protein AYK22_08370 [Thermoplasmatales archaeon SG8-52-3]